MTNKRSELFNLRIQKYFTPEGEHTCARDLSTKEMCPMLANSIRGEGCIWAGLHETENSSRRIKGALRRRGADGLGFLEPHRLCPLREEVQTKQMKSYFVRMPLTGVASIVVQAPERATEEVISEAFSTVWESMGESEKNGCVSELCYTEHVTNGNFNSVVPNDVEWEETNEEPYRKEELAPPHPDIPPGLEIVADEFFRDALHKLSGKKPPKHFRFKPDSPLMEEQQDWCSTHVRPYWACGISLLEAAEAFVLDAQGNGNIRFNEHAMRPKDFERYARGGGKNKKKSGKKKVGKK